MTISQKHPRLTEFSPSHFHTHNSRMGLSARVYYELMLPAVKAPWGGPSAPDAAECNDFMADLTCSLCSLGCAPSRDVLRVFQRRAVGEDVPWSPESPSFLKALLAKAHPCGTMGQDHCFLPSTTLGFLQSPHPGPGGSQSAFSFGN